MLTQAISTNLRAVGHYVLLIVETFEDFCMHGCNRKEVTRQIVRIGSDSLPIVMLTAIFSGMVLALQTAYGLERFGAKNYVGNVVGLALTRELGPVLTALMLCGRVGAGVAAEIASMVATEQVDAMRALGANPISKLVTPKVIAALIVMPALVIIGTLVGIYGGALVGVYELNLSAHMYYRSLVYTVVIRDVIDGAIKSAIFGFLLITISCYKGLNTRGGTEGVGTSTTSAVVTGSIVIFVSDFFITKLLLLIQ